MKQRGIFHRWLLGSVLGGLMAFTLVNPAQALRITRSAAYFAQVFAVAGTATSGDASIVERLVYSWIAVTAPEPKAKHSTQRSI